MTSTNPQAAPGRQVNPTEVGWQFVPQYYTFVNKHPNRLHCFYTKNSTFSHGTEGEDTKACYGQQEIHAKIMALNYENCKVFIHSVDAQSSAGGGILIQVVGEMSNRDESWKKFVQTFFLAEQPNGYFVLNDIFRFLKEESADEGDDQEDQEGEVDEEQPAVVQDALQEVAAPVPVSVSVPVDQISSFKPEEPAPPPSASPAPVVAVAEESAPEPVVPESTEAPHVNGVNGHSELAESEGIHEPEPTPVPQAEPEPATTIPEPTPAPEVPPPVKVPSPAPPAPVVPVETPQKSPAPTPAPQPPAPSGPKTWATLAASNNKKWGSVASDAKGVSAAAPQTPPPAPSPRPTSSANRTQEQPAPQPITTGQCFVKGVTENVTETTVREVLTARFGAIKDLEIVRSKACAFLEFTTVDAARKAIQASLPQHAGGEGGIRIDIKGGPGARLTVERRKERDERPPPRARGGAPSFGEGRGGATGAQAGEGRGGAQGGRGRGAARGRGGPPKS